MSGLELITVPPAPPPPLRPDVTFSYAALAFLCSWWMQIDAQWIEDEESESSQGGTLLHHAMSSFSTCGKGKELLPEGETTLHALYVQAKLWLVERRGTGRLIGLRSEKAFAYDLATRTARELVDPPGLEGTRWYADKELRPLHGIKPTEWCGRVDLWAWGTDAAGNSVLYLWDYKFHFQPDHLDARAQLEVGALALSRALGITRVIATAVHVWEDRVDDKEVYELGPADLNRIANEVDALARRPANDPQPLDGAHCKARYCPARASCPTTRAAAEDGINLIPAERLAKLPPRRPVGEPATTNDAAAWKLVAADLLEELAKAMRAEGRAYADANGGIVDSEGRVFSGQPQTTEKPDLTVPGAVDVVLAHGGDFAIKEVTTWTALEDEIGKPLALKVREELRKLNALNVSTFPVYKARTPKVEGAKTSRKRAS